MTKQDYKNKVWSEIKSIVTWTPAQFAQEFEYAYKAKQSTTKPQDLADALLDCYGVGLTGNPKQGFGHYEPRKSQFHFVLDSMGKREIMFRYGAVRLVADSVFKGDDFAHQPFETPPIAHKVKNFEKDVKDYIGTYAAAMMQNGEWISVFVSKSQMEAIKKTGRNRQAWNDYFTEFYAKSAINRLYKLFPKSAIPSAIRAAFALDYDTEIPTEKEENKALDFSEFEDAPTTEPTPPTPEIEPQEDEDDHPF